MTVLPEKLEKSYTLAEMLIVPAALRAAGPAVMTFKTGGDDAPAPSGPSKSDLFSKQFTEVLRKGYATLVEPRKPASPEEKAASKKKTGKAAMEERLSKYKLLSKEELESQLAAEKMGRALYQDNEFALSCLSMRYEKVIGKPFLLSQHPLHPQTLSALFQECCEKVTDNRTTLNATANSWAKAMEKAYPEWLEELNNALIKQRILPDLDEDDVNNRYRHSREAEKKRAQEMRQNLVTEITGKPAEGADAAQPEEVVQSLAKMVRDAGLTRQDMQQHIVSTKEGPAIEISDVLSALKQVKTSEKLNQETGYREIASEQTLAELLKATTNLANFALNDQAQSSISLLSMMFSKITEEESIASPIKPLLSDLQVPMLKKALEDETFFVDAENSAQQLVNEIAKVGTHWTPKQNASRDPLYKKLVSIVEEVKEKHEDNENVFEENLQNLNEFIEREERRASLLEERIIEAEAAAARAEVAKTRVKSAIAIRCFNKTVPPVTQRFLEEQWESVLFFHINKDGGEQSDELRQALGDLDQLIDASAGKAVDLKALFQSMNKQMVDIGLERGDREQLLKELLGELKQQRANVVQAEQARAEAAAKGEALPEPEPEPAPPPPPQESEAPTEIQDQHAELAAAIRVNSWFHWKPEENAEKQKVKLAAIIKHNGTYIFVNREGVKALVTNRAGVATHFRSGALAMIEDSVFFDRALESVIHSLRA